MIVLNQLIIIGGGDGSIESINGRKEVMIVLNQLMEGGGDSIESIDGRKR